MNMTVTALLLLIAASASTTAIAADRGLQAFVEDAAHLNQHQIEGGQLASERAVATPVRSYAKDALGLSTDAQSNLAVAATAGGAKMPSAIDDERAEMLSAIKNAPAHDFDAAYLSGQLSTYAALARLYKANIKDGRPGPVRTYAETAYSQFHMLQVRPMALSAAPQGVTDGEK